MGIIDGGKYGSALDAAFLNEHVNVNVNVVERLRNAGAERKAAIILELGPTDIICSSPTPVVMAVPENLTWWD